MINIVQVFKKITPLQCIFIFGVWTLTAISFATQIYFRDISGNSTVTWLSFFIDQVFVWYPCILFTPLVMGIYESYPLDSNQWRQYGLPHLCYALAVILLFSNLRLISIQWTLNSAFFDHLTIWVYISHLISQIPWETTLYILIVIVVFAKKVNTTAKNKELYAAQLDLHNQELQNQLSQAQLEALRLQLSPHFLFNALNTINALIRTEEYGTAIQVNTRLGDFLRKTLAIESRQFVTFEQEVAFLDLYLDIESVRFKDRLVIKKQIAPVSLTVAIPHLILQPLIENAIKHGISKFRNARLLEIKSEVQADDLIIHVYNDGALLPEDWKMLENERIGWKNVRQRLEKLYGDNYCLHLENHNNQHGVIATMRIPCL